MTDPTPDTVEPIRSGNRQGVMLSVLSFLHFATLGVVIPFLPLYLKRSLEFSWVHVGLVFGAFPLGTLLAPAVSRWLRGIGIDPRTGLAFGHLAAAGLDLMSQLDRSLIYRRVSAREVLRLDEIYPALEVGCLLRGEGNDRFKRDLADASPDSFQAVPLHLS